MWKTGFFIPCPERVIIKSVLIYIFMNERENLGKLYGVCLQILSVIHPIRHYNSTISENRCMRTTQL